MSSANTTIPPQVTCSDSDAGYIAAIIVLSILLCLVSGVALLLWKQKAHILSAVWSSCASRRRASTRNADDGGDGGGDRYVEDDEPSYDNANDVAAAQKSSSISSSQKQRSFPRQSTECGGGSSLSRHSVHSSHGERGGGGGDGGDGGLVVTNPALPMEDTREEGEDEYVAIDADVGGEGDYDDVEWNDNGPRIKIDKSDVDHDADHLDMDTSSFLSESLYVNYEDMEH